jgi:hypothetical protein
MRKQVFTFSILSILVSFSYAQTDVDALRYSTPAVQGTARNVALGNTMGTIGADISALSTNPAGIANSVPQNLFCHRQFLSINLHRAI